MGVALCALREAESAFIREGEVWTEPLHANAGREDDLLPAIDRLCRRQSASPASLRLVVVSAGPGGFTSLRVAVTVAKSLAVSVGAACVAVPTAVAIAARTAAAGSAFAVLLAGKGESAHATVFPRGQWRDPQIRAGLITARDVEKLGVQTIVGDAFVPGPILEEASRLGIEVQRPCFDAAACLEVGLTLQALEPVHLSPIYAREPEAVTKWRALHPKA